MLTSTEYVIHCKNVKKLTGSGDVGISWSIKELQNLHLEYTNLLLIIAYNIIQNKMISNFI